MINMTNICKNTSKYDVFHVFWAWSSFVYLYSDFRAGRADRCFVPTMGLDCGAPSLGGGTALCLVRSCVDLGTTPLGHYGRGELNDPQNHRFSVFSNIALTRANEVSKILKLFGSGGSSALPGTSGTPRSSINHREGSLEVAVMLF